MAATVLTLFSCVRFTCSLECLSRALGHTHYPGVIATTYTSHLGTVQRVTSLLFHSTTFVPVIHSLTKRSSEGQLAHTASGEARIRLNETYSYDTDNIISSAQKGEFTTRVRVKYQSFKDADPCTWYLLYKPVQMCDFLCSSGHRLT